MDNDLILSAAGGRPNAGAVLAAVDSAAAALRRPLRAAAGPAPKVATVRCTSRGLARRRREEKREHRPRGACVPCRRPKPHRRSTGAAAKQTRTSSRRTVKVASKAKIVMKRRPPPMAENLVGSVRHGPCRHALAVRRPRLQAPATLAQSRRADALGDALPGPRQLQQAPMEVTGSSRRRSMC